MRALLRIAAAYVEDRESGELYEIVLTPSKRRIEIDLASTLHEHTLAGAGAVARAVARAISGIQLSSQYRVLVARRSAGGAARVVRRSQLREVLTGTEFDHISVALDRRSAPSGP